MEMSPTQDIQTSGLLEAMLKWHTDATILAAKDKAAFGKYVKYEVIKAEVTPLLHSLGLFAHHISHPVQGGVAVETVIYHTSGGRMSGGIVKVPPSKPSEAQYGAALTYAKRFSLVLALGLGGDKDAIEHKTSVSLEDEITDDDYQSVPEPEVAKPAKKERTPTETKNRLFNEAKVVEAKTATEAKKRFTKYESAMRARGLDADRAKFDEWVKEKFSA